MRSQAHSLLWTHPCLMADQGLTPYLTVMNQGARGHTFPKFSRRVELPRTRFSKILEEKPSTNLGHSGFANIEVRHKI
jgi:hypothetical protein